MRVTRASRSQFAPRQCVPSWLPPQTKSASTAALAIDDDRNRLGQADRADEAGPRAGRGEDLRFVGEHRFARQFGQLRRLDLVDLVVAAHAQRDQAIGAAHDASS